VNGNACTGSIDALNPANGAFVWRTCQSNYMFSGITAVPGVVVEGDLGGNVLFLNAQNGSTLFTYKAATAVQGESSVSNGIVFVRFPTALWSLSVNRRRSVGVRQAPTAKPINGPGRK